jgi:hypothetical protein
LLALGTQPGRDLATAPARCRRAMRRLMTTLAILCLVAPAAAHADGSVTTLLRDACNDEHVDGHYTQAQYKKALDQLAADSDEYTACRDVIERARLAALSGSNKHSGGGGGSTGATGGGSSGGSSGGGSSGTSGTSGNAPADPLASASPKQRKALAQVGKNAKPVDIGGKLVQPGALGLGTLSGSGHGVPTPLVALIALLAASALGAGGWWLWSRVLARRFG